MTYYAEHLHPDELADMRLPEPVVDRPLPLIGVLAITLMIVAISILLAVAVWLVWDTLDDTVTRSGALPAACDGLTNAWDCVARTQQ